MSMSYTEKSPVDRDDYEGLQIDTRANDNTEKHLNPLSTPQDMTDQDDSDSEDNYLSEKQAAADIPQTSPKWSGSTAGSDKATPVPVPILPDDSAGSPPAPKIRRICGVRRRNFWVVFGVILGTVVAAAIIGGAVGGTRHFSSSISQDSNETDTASTGTNSTGTISTGQNSEDKPFSASDVVIGSPLSVISYSDHNTGEQTFRMYFQSAGGNIKESFRTGIGNWSDALPIFTDAINNTGLAAITYYNDTSSQQQASVFYVDKDRYLREKRASFGSENKWIYTGLSIINTPFQVGNGTTSDWDSYRMTAVYSEHFSSGPGCRLFYHDANSKWVQELIWNQKNDTWTRGKSIYDALPNSPLSATVDNSAKTLSLFYLNKINKKQQLQYSWTDITVDKGYLKETIGSPSAISPDGNIAAISNNGTTYVYYNSNSANNRSAIREIRIWGQPGSDKFNDSNNFQVDYSENNASPYQPLTAVKTGNVSYVFWADHTTGSTDFSLARPNNSSGYSRLFGVSRRVDDTRSNWINRTSVPLGQENDAPHRG